MILTGLAVWMMIRGVSISTRIAGLFLGVEMLVLVVVSLAVLIKNGGRLSLTPFEPSQIDNGLSGLAAGFPLAIYLFIGWENSAALAEETNEPRRNVPRAVFSSIAIMSVSYVVFAYATVTGFGYDVDKLGGSAIPFMDVADSTLGVLAFFAYLSGLTSTLGALIAGSNAHARLVFNAGRKGLLPSWIGCLHRTRRTPMNAIVTFVGLAVVLIGGWGLGHIIGRRWSGDGPGGVLRGVLDDGHDPRAGGVPAVEPRPAGLLPQVSAVIAVAYAIYLARGDPSLGDRVGSIVADE